MQRRTGRHTRWYVTALTGRCRESDSDAAEIQVCARARFGPGDSGRQARTHRRDPALSHCAKQEADLLAPKRRPTLRYGRSHSPLETLSVRQRHPVTQPE